MVTYTYSPPSQMVWKLTPQINGHVEVIWKGRKLDCIILGDLLKVISPRVGISCLAPSLEIMRLLRAQAGEGNPEELSGWK